MANYSGTKLVGVEYKSRRKMKNSPLCVHVLHKTLNVVISRCCFAEDGKEMYQNVKRACRAIVFAHETYCFAALSLPSPSSLLKLPNHKHETPLRPSHILALKSKIYNISNCVNILGKY